MDLLAAAFVSLASAFFDHSSGKAVPRELEPLPPKRETQDDPFDVRVGDILAADLPGIRGAATSVRRARGPLISPDLVLIDETGAGARARGPIDDAAPPVAWAAGVEVKKLQPSATGIGRASGMDYNSTPPTPVCRIGVAGTIGTLAVPATYTFAILDARAERPQVSGLVMCVGSVLDASDEEYLRAIGSRTKLIGLGSYGDGMDRVRPMFVYPNPLSASDFAECATLVSERSDLDTEYPQLAALGTLRRTLRDDGGQVEFTYYTMAADAATRAGGDLLDPFRAVANRSESTAARGRFVLEL